MKPVTPVTVCLQSAPIVTVCLKNVDTSNVPVCKPLVYELELDFVEAGVENLSVEAFSSYNSTSARSKV